MKIRSVALNNRKKAFAVQTISKVYTFPYSKADPAPDTSDPVVGVQVDPELAREGFVFTLASGQQGTVHIEQVLDYNKDPGYLRDLLLYKLTLEAQRKLEATSLSRREVIRRLGTSATQFYRIIDQTNYRKSIDKVLNLLHVLDCEVELVVKEKTG